MQSKITRRRLLGAGAAAAAIGTTQAQPESAFWKSWSDGRAEVSSYDLTIPYGRELCQGVALAIFAPDEFSSSDRVKAEPGRHPKADVFPVMKLNLIKEYQTGISNRHEQTASFLAFGSVNGRLPGSLTKASFSRQDWEGAIYQQLLFDQKAIRSVLHSYRDGEGDQQKVLEFPISAISEDSLWFWARQMAQPYVERGEYRLAPILVSMQSQRDTGQPIAIRQGKFTRSPVNQRIALPGGTFNVELCTVQIDASIRKFWVEREAPHRVIRWETSEGEKGQLLASKHLKYWEMTGKGGEDRLKELKLLPRPVRTL
ncbi:MAG: hypothetical protein ABI823_20665 [Bryobacteraceae bacterium]